MKHTPGPWKAEFWDYGDELWFGGSGAGMWSIGPAYLGGDGPEKEGLERMEADARLIAAAPDLLAALKTFVAEYVELVESGDAGFWDAEEEAKVIAARAAIAKAEGRS